MRPTSSPCRVAGGRLQLRRLRLVLGRAGGRCDANGIGRPTVLITEFGWPGTPSAGEVMAPDNVPWAAGLYARFRTVKGVALWDQGDMSALISRMTA